MRDIQLDQPVPVRRYQRASLDLYVNKIIGDEPHLARVRDISPGGVFLYRLLEPNGPHPETVGLEMQLPGTSHVIWAVGKVVRQEEGGAVPGMAIRFVRMAEADRRFLARFVDNLSGTSPPSRAAIEAA